MKAALRVLGIAGLIVCGLQVGCGKGDSVRSKAEKGDADAQFNLGAMYQAGDGVPQDSVEAAKWYRKAADQGNTFAQFNLGVMCAHGEGVAKDSAEAVRWLRKAADQGFADAQYNLGLMYADGKGVPKDAVEAYRWFNLAAASGDAEAVERRRLLELKMTAAQIAEALRLSREFKPQKPAVSADISRPKPSP